MKAKAAEAWAGLRAIYEGAVPTMALLAQAGRLTEVGVTRHAQREGWKAPEDDAKRKRQRRVRGQITRLDAQVDRLITEAEAGDGLDKGKVDLLSTLLRSIEKLRELVPVVQPEDNVKERDVRVASSLGKIHTAIRALAGNLAADARPQRGRG